MIDVFRKALAPIVATAIWTSSSVTGVALDSKASFVENSKPNDHTFYTSMETLLQANDLSIISNTKFNQIISVGSKFCLITPSSDGFLSVFLGGKNIPFKKLIPKSILPSNRINFCALEINSEMFLLIGGIGPNIFTLELWIFNITSLEWKALKNTSKKVPQIGYHQAVLLNSNPLVAYIFGGNSGFDTFRSLLIAFINLTNLTFSITVQSEYFKENLTWPQPRIGHSMTFIQEQCYVFGGISSSGQTFSDIWELDCSLFKDHPLWKPNIPKQCLETPTARYNHVAWANSKGFFIAGGLDSQGNPLHDIWQYHNGIWKRIHIFETKNPIFHTEEGLCEINNATEISTNPEKITVSLCSTSPPFASLTPLFDELKRRQAEYSILEQFEKDCNTKIQNEINEFSEVARSSSLSSQKVSAPVKKVQNTQKGDPEKMLQEISDETISLKLDLCQNASELSDLLSSYLNKTIPHPTIELTQDYLSLSLHLEQIKSELENSLKEHQTEVDLYRKQLDLLGGEPKEVPDLNPADFSGFIKFFSTLPKESQGQAITNYYAMQLHRYSQILSKIQKKKEKKVSNKLLHEIRTNYDYLTKKLNENYQQFYQIRERLEVWSKSEEKAHADLVRAQEIQKQLQSSQKTPLTHQQTSEKTKELLKSIYDKDEYLMKSIESLQKSLDSDNNSVNQADIFDQLKHLISILS